MKIGAAILAAGGSTRLGSPKQLLEYDGKTLLRRTAETALATVCRPVWVVLGSGADRLKSELAGLDVRCVDNPSWGGGMGTSVRLGVETLAPDTDAVLLMLCDQPLVGPVALARLLDAFRPGTITAAAYNGTVGVPAIFDRIYFDELRVLPDYAGAKPVLMRHHASVIEVPLPEAAIDIDTREQYERLNNSCV